MPKKGLSQQITENWQNDDYKRHHTSNKEHDIKTIFFKMLVLSCLTTITMINIALKTSYSA